MKKIILLPALALLLFPAWAQAGNSTDRTVALNALSAHQKSQKVFRTTTLPSTFIQSWKDEAVCLNAIADNIAESSMNNEEKLVYFFSLAFLASVDFYITASKEKGALVQKQSNRLQKIATKLRRSAADKRGKTIARSLQGHKTAMLAFLRARGASFDFCALETAITEEGGYTSENIEKALQETIPGTWVEKNGSGSAFDKNSRRASKLISRGERAMSKVRPRIRAKRINRYSNFPNLSLGENTSWKEGGLPQYLPRSGEVPNLQEALKNFSK